MNAQKWLTAVSTSRMHMERASDALLGLPETERTRDLRVQLVAALRAVEAEEERLCAVVHGPAHGRTA